MEELDLSINFLVNLINHPWETPAFTVLPSQSITVIQLSRLHEACWVPCLNLNGLSYIIEALFTKLAAAVQLPLGALQQSWAHICLGLVIMYETS